MDVSVFIQIVGSLGFPIAACVAMFWMLNKQQDQHREEMDAIRESLNANTAALSDLRATIQVLGGVSHDLAG